jgi:hypothetical protein
MSFFLLIYSTILAMKHGTDCLKSWYNIFQSSVCNKYVVTCQVTLNIWRMLSSGMWRHVDLVWIDILEECMASIFRVGKSISEEPAWAGDCRLTRGFFYPEDEGDTFLWNVASHKIYIHGDTSQETAFFIATAVKTSYLTLNIRFQCIIYTRNNAINSYYSWLSLIP